MQKKFFENFEKTIFTDRGMKKTPQRKVLMSLEDEGELCNQQSGVALMEEENSCLKAWCGCREQVGHRLKKRVELRL